MRRETGDLRPVEREATGIARQIASEQIDQRGLAGAIGSDDRRQYASFQRQLDAVDGNELAERLAQTFGVEQGVYRSPP
jgi:hypothetical protein